MDNVTDIEAILSALVPIIAATVFKYIKSKKNVSEEQAQIIFQYAEKVLSGEDMNPLYLKTLEKLESAWFDESVSTEQMKAILQIWSTPKVRTLKEL